MAKILNFHRFILLILLVAFLAYGADPVAVIIKTRGRVDLTRKDETKPEKGKKGLVLYDGDKIETATTSFCAIKFIDDKSLLRIKESSTCVIEGEREEDHINKNIVVKVGTFFASLFKQRGQFLVTTPTSVASVKGTQFWIIQFADGRTNYIGIEGLIDLVNDAGRVLLRQGQTAVFTSGNQLPEIRITREREVPRLDDGIEEMKSLEIEFKDNNGQTKKLRLDYTEQ